MERLERAIKTAAQQLPELQAHGYAKGLSF
jgi:hypothetical protein